MKIIFYILIISSIFCSELGSESYIWPTDASKTLTAVFGDVRPRRYHAGLDVRTYGLSGHDLYAIEDGYIERIRVSSSGYGKAIYLRLKDNRIAVYAHLSQFTPQLNSLVKEYQKSANKYSINQILEPNKYLVKKGDIIGYTGDTGSISGPHLHFEIRDENNKPLNPLLTNYSIKDSHFPVAKMLAIIPLEEISRVNGDIKPVTVPIKKINNKIYKIDEKINISGPFGLAIQIIDKIDKQPFKFGLYRLEMNINGKKYYSIKYEQFDFNEGELVYTERDYALIRNGEGKYYRLFRDNKRKKLSFHQDGLESLINLPIGQHDLEIIASDYNNNEIIVKGKINLEKTKIKYSEATFSNNEKNYGKNCINCKINQFEHGTFISVPKEGFNSIPEIIFINNEKSNKPIDIYHSQDIENFNYVFNPTSVGEISGIIFYSKDQKLEHKLIGKPAIPEKPFYIDFEKEVSVVGSGDTFYDSTFVWIKKLNSIKSNEGKIISGPWEIGPEYIPYKNQIDIQVKYSPENMKLKDNISIYYLNKKNQAWYYMPTTFDFDKNIFKTSALSGEVFALIMESESPKINSFFPQFGKQLNSNKQNQLSFKITDNLSGIDGENDVKVYINQNPIIHEYNSYRKEVIYDLNEDLKSGKNLVKIVVNDRAANSTIISGHWFYND